ncbi:MAG: M20/M25/M40 family metallo-hydrolase [Caldilineaceae bacterium]|nr:M20/M25/M40 family metallo-hydrolase [Caldilineaceae bacterium]
MNQVVHPFWLLAGLVVMALAFGLQALGMPPPAPKPETAPANEFSAARALTLAARLIEDGTPHPMGTQANDQIRSRILDELTTFGYTVETQDTLTCRTVWAVCGYVRNIITRLPGRAEGPAVLLVAHYDSVGAGPGAADDMAGVAILLEIARMLRTEGPLSAPIIFLLSDGEEVGLLGAEAFVAEHPWAAEVGVVVNLEARGTSGPSILFETTENNTWMIDAFVAHAPRAVTNSLADEIYELLPNDTDLSVFEEAGIAGINFGFVEEYAHYHTPLNNLTNLNPGSVQHQGDNVLAAVRGFAELDLANPPAGNSVFLDLWPGLILQWPEAWTIWIALACLLAWLGLAVTLLRRGALPMRSLLWGALVLPLGLLVATLLGLVLVIALSSLTGAPVPWYAHPLPVRVALWAGAIFSMALVGTAFARRAGFWGLSLGVWLWWCLLSLLLAWSLPGVSIIFLCPTLLALLALSVVGMTPLDASPRNGEIASLVALFGTSALWLPFALYVEVGAGLEIGALAGLGVGLATSALLPFLALPEEARPIRRGVLAAAALVMVAAFGVASWVPTHSEFRPQRLNLLHVEQRHLDQVNWLIESATLTGETIRDVPQSLRQAAPFGGEPVAALPWSSRQYLVAPATSTSAPAPEIHLLSDARTNGARRLHLQLRSPRGGAQIKLYIPQAASLSHIEVLGTPYIMEETFIENGYHLFACFAPACDGLEVALHLESNTPFTLLIVDATPGLPPGDDMLIQARPNSAVPSQDGDVTLIANELLIK